MIASNSSTSFSVVGPPVVLVRSSWTLSHVLLRDLHHVTDVHGRAPLLKSTRVVLAATRITLPHGHSSSLVAMLKYNF